MLGIFYTLSIWCYTTYMEYTRRLMYRYGFILFFVAFGVIAMLIYIISQRQIDRIRVSNEDASLTSTSLYTSIDITQYTSKIENALIVVPDTNTRLSLIGGRASYGTSLDGGDVALVKLLGGVSVDKRTSHVFADIAVQSGGTGVFHYVALFEIIDGTVQHTASYFIGDRVTVDSVAVTPVDTQLYTVRINYLDRGIEQAMTGDPTVPQVLDLRVQNALFVGGDM